MAVSDGVATVVGRGPGAVVVVVERRSAGSVVCAPDDAGSPVPVIAAMIFGLYIRYESSDDGR